MDRARKQTWLVGLFAVGAGLGFARCKAPDNVLFKCEDGGRCLQTGYVCAASGYCLPPELACRPVDPGWSWDGGAALPQPMADFVLGGSSNDLLLAAGGVTDGGLVADNYAVLTVVPAPYWQNSNYEGTAAVARARFASAPSQSPLGIVLSGGLSDAGEYLDTMVVVSSTAAPQTLPLMPEPRADHAMVALDGHDFLLAGGRGADGGLLASAELYGGGPSDDAGFDAGQWVLAAALPEPRALHTLTRLPDGRVLLAGGWTESGLSKSLYVFPSDGGWESLGGLGAARAGHVALPIDAGEILFVGGEPTGKVEIFDPSVQAMAQSYLLGFDATESSAVYVPEKGMALVVGSEAGVNAAPQAAWCNACGCVPAARPNVVRYGAKLARVPGFNVVVLAGGRDPSGAPVKDVEYMSWQ